MIKKILLLIALAISAISAEFNVGKAYSCDVGGTPVNVTIVSADMVFFGKYPAEWNQQINGFFGHVNGNPVVYHLFDNEPTIVISYRGVTFDAPCYELTEI